MAPRKSAAAVVRSDSEESDPPARKGGSPNGRETKGSKSAKGRKNEVVDEGDDDEREAAEVEEEVDEEEYEIEKVMKVKKRMYSGRDGYFVKWKGYPHSENSWVDALDFHAPELLVQFYDEEERKAGAAKPKGRASATGRKSEVQSRRKSEVDQLPSDEEEERETSKGASTSKRGRKSTGTTAPAAKKAKPSDNDMDVDEEEPPKKKPKTATGKGKKAPARSVSPSELSPANGAQEGDGEDAELPDEAHDAAIMEKYMGQKDWTKIIKKIETVESIGEDLLVYFITKDGTRSVQNSAILRERCPKILIDFYESHLRWKGKADQEE